MKNVMIGDAVQTITSGILIHGCNAQGVMGGGIALKIRQKYPKAFNDYSTVYANGHLKLGHVVKTEISPGFIIANAITQQHYGNDPNRRYVSHLAIQKAFNDVVNHARAENLIVHYPLIGAGLANGDWGVISEIIDAEFDACPEVIRCCWILD